jgi:hypothetical protein
MSFGLVYRDDGQVVLVHGDDAGKWYSMVITDDSEDYSKLADHQAVVVELDDENLLKGLATLSNLEMVPFYGPDNKPIRAAIFVPASVRMMPAAMKSFIAAAAAKHKARWN